MRKIKLFASFMTLVMILSIVGAMPLSASARVNTTGRQRIVQTYSGTNKNQLLNGYLYAKISGAKK